MKQKLISVFVFAVGLFVVSIPLLAHHGVAGYDLTKTVTVHGTVTKFDWSNPHCVIHMDEERQWRSPELDDRTGRSEPIESHGLVQERDEGRG